MLPRLKIAVDAGGNAGDWWLTGSQPFHLMQGISESLAGRVAVLSLAGLSRREALRMPPPPPFAPAAPWFDALTAGVGPPDEVDLLIEADGRLRPVEIRKTASPGLDALAGMLSQHKLGVPLATGAVVCMVTRPLSASPQVLAWPAGWL